MEGFALFALLFALANAITYVVAERRNRSQWVRDVAYTQSEQDVQVGYRADGSHSVESAYRGPCIRPRAPLGVRAVAMWSIGLGQMTVPGALAALFGLAFYGAGALGIPGCILAARIWSIGHALLRADPRAVERSRSIAHAAVVLNVVVLAVSALMLFSDDLLGLGVFMTAYAFVSLAHAAALWWAGGRVEALWCERGYRADRLSSLKLPRRSVANLTHDRGSRATIGR